MFDRGGLLLRCQKQKGGRKAKPALQRRELRPQKARSVSDSSFAGLRHVFMAVTAKRCRRRTACLPPLNGTLKLSTSAIPIHPRLPKGHVLPMFCDWRVHPNREFWRVVAGGKFVWIVRRRRVGDRFPLVGDSSEHPSTKP